MLEIWEANYVDGTNFQLWKMHMTFIFQSRDRFSVVNGSVKKSVSVTDQEKLLWGKQAIVIILVTIDWFLSIPWLCSLGPRNKRLSLNNVMWVVWTWHPFRNTLHVSFNVVHTNYCFHCLAYREGHRTWGLPTRVTWHMPLRREIPSKRPMCVKTTIFDVKWWYFW